MTTVKQYLATAAKEIGTRESPPPPTEHTKYSKFFGVDDLWCAMFQWWVTNHAGDKKPLFMRTAFTPALQQHFVDEKRHGDEPRKGALVFFDFPGDELDRTQHVEVVESFTATQLVTIGANTSPDGGGPTDGVFRRHRPRNSSITGYGYPPYVDSEVLPRFSVPKAKTFIGKGDSGRVVKLWQRHLNRWMALVREQGKADFDFGKIEVTGRFDKDTLMASKTFQNVNKLDVDGRVGKHTIAKMERILERKS
jgi:Putative peptidoglycan binding domain/CHAP domain